MPRLRHLTAATVLAACLSMVLSWTVPAFAAAPAVGPRTAGSAQAPDGAKAGQAPTTGAILRQAKRTGAALLTKAVQPVPSGDEIVDGRGDAAGWHLYAASSGGGWHWQPLATLDPAGLDPAGERGIGRECRAGGGR